MSDALNLLGIVGFIVGTLALSAAVTYVVVKVDGLIRARRRAAS